MKRGMTPSGQSGDFQGNSATICQMFVLFRHGERAPLFLWSADPGKKNHPNGVGSLTNKGKEQGYKIGQFIRQLHPGFLDDKYLKEEIYVHSTNTSRTMMTALCCLAGLYPPKGDDVWLADMPWQPIPVNTAPRESDPFALRFEREDLLVSIESADTATNDHYKVLSDHKHIIKALTEESKKDGKDGCLFTMAIIFDGYFEKAAKDLPGYLPPGVDPVDLTTATRITAALYSLLLSSKGTLTPPAHHLRDILSKSEKTVEGNAPMKKVYLYSTHDITINNCFTLLNITEDHAAYGATIIFELHKNPENEEYYMKLIYKHNIESPEDPKTLPIGQNESKIIPFSEFQQIIQAIKVEEE